MAFIKKKEVEQFRVFALELNSFVEDPFKQEYSEAITPELAAILGGVGTGFLGISTIFTWLSGMSGAQIMAALASFGFGGAVGGIATLTVSVAVPVVLVAGSFYTVANQRKLKQELIKLFRFVKNLEPKLVDDERSKVQELLKSIDLTMVELKKLYKISKVK
ncbi:hypothetical protein AB6P17_07540 [Streptococcus mutans]|uniref:hypothetical protein n=1 Tax=Streptococcus mutans TaxID=1309 RepID=UPI0038B87101